MNRAAMTTDDVLARLKAFKKSRETEYQLTSLGVFGSFAQGRPREN